MCNIPSPIWGRNVNTFSLVFYKQAEISGFFKLWTEIETKFEYLNLSLPL